MLAAAVGQRGGSRVNRRPNKIRNFEDGWQRLRRDYFHDDCLYDIVDFERLFRMIRTVFKRV